MDIPVLYGGRRIYKGIEQKSRVMATLPKGKYLLKMVRTEESPVFYVPTGDKKAYLFLGDNAKLCSRQKTKTFDSLVLLPPEAFSPESKH